MKSILIADDEPSLRRLMLATLDGPELHITEANSGNEVLRIAGEQRFDLILLDWMMPGLSGIEVLERLRRQPATANVPVVMLTARGQSQDKECALRSGATAYVVKPFSPLELLERINGILHPEKPEAENEPTLAQESKSVRTRRHG